MNATSDHKETDRRAAERYSIERDIRWNLQGEHGREAPVRGRTANISSAGVLFTTVSSVPLGRQVEVAIHWPVALDVGGELDLVGRGRVVRSTDGHAAVRFQHREFQPRNS